jgi:hypothetical protein
MKHARLFPALALFVAPLVMLMSLDPAMAGDAVFPQGLRIGMTPLVGLVPAKTFAGFETADESVKVLVAELPASAYGEVVNALKTNPVLGNATTPESIETPAGAAYYMIETGKTGGNVVRRYSMILSGGAFSAYIAMQVPENASKIYSDEAVRQMFTSATVRKEVPVSEFLDMMPFKASELANFKTVRALTPGPALLLADGDEATGLESGSFMVIGLMGSAPKSSEDRGRFAEQAATSIPGVRNWRLTMSEPVRIDGLAGYETRLDATSGKDNTPVTLVQWLRFGGGNTMRIIGSAPRDRWTEAFPRFRAVRDGVQPR